MDKTKIITRCLVVFVVLAAGALIAPYLSAEAGARRTYNHFLDLLETGEVEKLKKMLSPAYADKAGFNRDEFLELLRLFRRQIYACKISRSENSALFDEAKKSATFTVTVSVTGTGSRVVADILEFSRYVPTPVTVQLERTSWKPWNWQIISTDHAHAGSAKKLKLRLKQYEYLDP